MESNELVERTAHVSMLQETLSNVKDGGKERYKTSADMLRTILLPLSLQSNTKVYVMQMRVVMLCFDCFTMCVRNTKNDSRQQQSTPYTLRKYWDSHFRSSMFWMMDYVLNDLHPYIDDEFSPARALDSVVKLLSALTILGIENLLDTEPTIRYLAKIFCRYVNRYAFHPQYYHGPEDSAKIMMTPFMLGSSERTKLIYPILASDPHLISSFVSHFSIYAHDPERDETVHELRHIMNVLLPVIATSPDLGEPIDRFLPDALKLWSSLFGKLSHTPMMLTQSGVFVGIENCVALVRSTLFRQGGKAWRAAVQQHFLQLILRTFARYHESDLDFMSPITMKLITSDFFVPLTHDLTSHLIHCSILSPTLRALQKIQREGLDRPLMQQKRPEYKSLRAAWVSLCKAVHDRATVMMKFRKFTSFHPLCGLNKVRDLSLIYTFFLSCTYSRLNSVRKTGRNVLDAVQVAIACTTARDHARN